MAVVKSKSKPAAGASPHAAPAGRGGGSGHGRGGSATAGSAGLSSDVADGKAQASAMSRPGLPVYVPKLIVGATSYEGPTASGAGADRFYNKVGLYRDRWREPMTMYVDNYTLGDSFDQVDPSRFGRQP